MTDGYGRTEWLEIQRRFASEKGLELFMFRGDGRSAHGQGMLQTPTLRQAKRIAAFLSRELGLPVKVRKR